MKRSNKQQTKFANIPNRRYNGDGMCGVGNGVEGEMNNENKIIYEAHLPSGIPIHTKSQQQTALQKTKRGMPMPVPPLRNGSNISHSRMIPTSSTQHQSNTPNATQISISKTATNILNGIYENGLINQTSYDQYNNVYGKNTMQNGKFNGAPQQMQRHPASNPSYRNLNNRQPTNFNSIYDIIGPSKPVAYNNAPHLRQPMEQPPTNKSTFELINNVLSPEILKYFQNKALMNTTQQNTSSQEENKMQTNRINVMLETAQALATAAYLER